MWSYVSQVVPTMLGQGERAFENTRMQTYTDKNSGVPTDVQYAVGKMSAKIPQWDYAQIVYTDAWGRTQTDTEDATLHALAQFFSPGYLSKIETSPMELELNRLYKATGGKGVLIASADRKIEYTWEDVNGEKHSEKKNLTADEYLTYNTTRGQLAYQLMTELTERSFYANKSDDVKADLVEKVYEYATACGKKQVVSQFELPSWVQKAQTASADIGLSEIEFIDAYVTYGSSYFTDSAYEKLKQAADIGVSVGDYVALKRSVDADQSGSVTQAEAQAYLDSTNFTREQKPLDMYETCFYTFVHGGHKVNATERSAMFIIDGKYFFDVKEKASSRDTIRPTAVGELETGRGNMIPLWLLGFLY
jgi:hypothetical protein